MIYTSGIALEKTKYEDLETLQRQKLDLVCEKIRLQPGEKHLDIGCGWGTLAVHAARHFGSESTGVTLSENQCAFARARAMQEGVGQTTKFLRMDYRDMDKTKYDKITCLEMAEHVGVRKFQEFLLQVREMMHDDGVFFMQIAGLRRAWQVEDFIWVCCCLFIYFLEVLIYFA